MSGVWPPHNCKLVRTSSRLCPQASSSLVRTSSHLWPPPHWSGPHLTSALLLIGQDLISPLPSGLLIGQDLISPLPSGLLLIGQALISPLPSGLLLIGQDLISPLPTYCFFCVHITWMYCFSVSTSPGCTVSLCPHHLVVLFLCVHITWMYCVSMSTSPGCTVSLCPHHLTPLCCAPAVSCRRGTDLVEPWMQQPSSSAKPSTQASSPWSLSTTCARRGNSSWASATGSNRYAHLHMLLAQGSHCSGHHDMCFKGKLDHHRHWDLWGSEVLGVGCGNQ